MILRILTCSFMVISGQILAAEETLEPSSCYTATNNQIDTCHALSTSAEIDCEFKITDTTNKEASDLIIKYSNEHITESAFGLLILQGSKHKDALEKYKSAADLCKKELNNYKSSCENLSVGIQTCENSEIHTTEDSTSLNKSLFYVTQNKIIAAKENLSALSKKIDSIEAEIPKIARDLCKQGFEASNKQRDCENLSPDLSKKIQHAFESCAKENDYYSKSECFQTVKPSLKGDYLRPVSQAAIYENNQTENTYTTIAKNPTATALDISPEKSSEKVERALASDSIKTKPMSIFKKNNIDQSEYNEVDLLKKGPDEPAATSKAAKNEFKWPSLSTILKIAAGSVLIYGAVTGKLKKWVNKLFEAINPYSNSNARSPSSTSGSNNAAGGSGCYGTFRGTIDMPPHEERIIARNIKIRSMGKQVTGNPAIDNAATGGGAPDGGMFLTGSFVWETDANCRVVSGTAYIFGHPFSITGAINKDRTFNLSYLGPMPGHITANNLVKGKLQHGGGEEYIYGYLNGHFTPKK